MDTLGMANGQDMPHQAGEPTDQLTLGLALDDSAVFANYFPCDGNALALAKLTSVGLDGKGADFIFLWGEGSPGLTHLLQATCHQSAALGLASFYLSLQEVDQLTPDVIEGLESIEVICLDDLDAVAGLAEWEAALFTLFNKIKEAGNTLVIASRLTPTNLPVILPDLKSRLQSGLTLQVHELTDEQKRDALIMRARMRGMEMSPAVGEYILARAERGLPALLKLLDRLDASTIKQQRLLTIPLVKSTLGW